jgi:hypothetical protein
MLGVDHFKNAFTKESGERCVSKHRMRVHWRKSVPFITLIHATKTGKMHMILLCVEILCLSVGVNRIRRCRIKQR